jgi:enoyl-CoA hydratase
MASDEPVLISRTGRLGRVTLNRPRALNALTHEALVRWADDDSVDAVLLDGAGERGLCAGADIRAVRDDALAGGRATPAFWQDEYRLNAFVAEYPKPYVALMDGIVMGGGVGVSAHGSVRIVTERSAVAMPETGIGLVPDVGGTHLLSRAPGELGTHLALTGAVVGAADAVLCGLADVCVPSQDLPALAAALADAPAEPVAVAGRLAVAPPAGELAGHREWIDACYAADSVEDIVARLQGHGHPAAKQAAETLLDRSPRALKAALAVLRAARGLGLRDALVREYRASCAALATADLAEGIRARIVDKDRAPRWSPPDLSQVGESDVASYLAVPADGDLVLGGPRSTGA